MAHAMPERLDPTASMSAHVADLERCLLALDAAFASGNGDQIDLHCQQLQRSLADSLVAFRHAEHAGLRALSPELQGRLMLAQARVLAQQAAVHRARGSIERTLGVLLQREESATYSGLAQSPAAKALNAYR
jgi:hypothetical protein